MHTGPSLNLLRLVALAGLLLQCLPLLSQSSPTSGTIVGQVRVGAGHMLNDRLEVRLETRGAYYGSSYTDMEGRFSFSGLANNLYHVVINDSRFQPVRLQFSISATGIQNHITNIYLVSLETTSKEQASTGSNPYLVDLDSLNREYPREAVRAFKDGIKQSERGKHKEAVKKFRRALELSPEFFRARNNLGTSLMALGDMAEAEREFQTVLEKNQTDAAAYFNLANICLQTQRLPAAQAHIENGLRREPRNVMGMFLMGVVYARTGQVREAERQMQATLQTDPTLSRVHIELGSMYLRMEMREQALTELKLFLTQFPNDPMAPKVRNLVDQLKQ